MKITYDARSDALYIALTPQIGAGEAARTEEAEPGVLLDRDASGRLLGIEILGAAARGYEVERLESAGLPVTALAAHLLAQHGGSQAELKAPPRRRSTPA